MQIYGEIMILNNAINDCCQRLFTIKQYSQACNVGQIFLAIMCVDCLLMLLMMMYYYYREDYKSLQRYTFNSRIEKEATKYKSGAYFLQSFY